MKRLLIITLILCFCVSFMTTPSFAVVPVFAPEVAAGICACLGVMGLHFSSQSFNQSDLAVQIYTWAIDTGNTIFSSTSNAITVVSDGVIKVSADFWDGCVDIVDYWSNTLVGSSSGSYDIVSPSVSGLTFDNNFVVPVVQLSVNGTYAEYPLSSMDTSTWLTASDLAAYTSSSPLLKTFSSTDWIQLYRTSSGTQAVSKLQFHFHLDDALSTATQRNFPCALVYDSGRYGMIGVSGTGSSAKLAVTMCDADFGIAPSSASSESLSLSGSLNSSIAVDSSQDVYISTPDLTYTDSATASSQILQSVINNNTITSSSSVDLSDLIDTQAQILTNTTAISGSLSQTLAAVQAIASDIVSFISSLPSYLSQFGGKFASIWYYVVNWVTSLSPFFVLISGVWSHLPAAMVLPVYASAVICVVLGMYKRFFM